jgi:hypothetical protein
MRLIDRQRLEASEIRIDELQKSLDSTNHRLDRVAEALARVGGHPREPIPIPPLPKSLRALGYR